MSFELGMTVKTKKPHVCKNNEWEVIRTGVDIKLKCVGCERIIMIPRIELEKKIKK